MKEQSDAQNVVSRFPSGDITRRRQAATTLGAKPRQPTPLNPLNLLNPLNPGRGAALFQNPLAIEGKIIYHNNDILLLSEKQRQRRFLEE